MFEIETSDFIEDLKEGLYQNLNKNGIDKVVKEIERLNNIINELERTIYYKAKYFRDVKEKNKVEICMDILDKLKELKGE